MAEYLPWQNIQKENVVFNFMKEKNSLLLDRHKFSLDRDEMNFIVLKTIEYKIMSKNKRTKITLLN